MPVSIQDIPSTEQLRDSRPKIVANFLAIKGLLEALETSNQLKANADEVDLALLQKASTGHTHGIGNISGLQAALDAKALLCPEIVLQTAITRTFAAGDAGKLFVYDNASNGTFTLPDEVANIPIGAEFAVFQKNTGQPTIVGAAGVVIDTPNTGIAVKTRVQKSAIGVKKLAANYYFAFGELATS